MSSSKAYELPDKKKYPELYKSDGFMRTKLHDAIKNYSYEHMHSSKADDIDRFLTFFEKGNIKPSKIKEKLPELCKGGRILEAEFVLALQGEKLKKEDILNLKSNGYSALWNSTEEESYLIRLCDVMQRAGDSITKQDMVETKKYNKNMTSLVDGSVHTIGTIESSIIAVAAIRDNLDNVKDIIEMNGEKLTKQDLIATISEDEANDNRIINYKGNSIACVALRRENFDVVEQILTEEGTTLSIKDVMNGKKYKHEIGRLFSSPVFKDTTKNIHEAWEDLPEGYKKTERNQDGYKTAIGRAKAGDAKKAAQALNKGGIAALKKAAGR
ncbi:MAG: hypothetical protein KAJ75_00320 [Alphaproteobacteria bacterium]|nr:hypothetical protein [Alphaproteobacteria bacterium]